MSSRSESVLLFPDFEVFSDDVFVDVGCGSGGDCRSAASVGADVIAIDIMQEGVAAAAAACEGVGARSFRGIVSDSNPIPLPDATASAIICLEVMEHVADPAQFLKELVRVGKPGSLCALGSVVGLRRRDEDRGPAVVLRAAGPSADLSARTV